MISKEEFGSQVADAYEHLYDLVYLRTHLLLDILVPSPSQSLKQRTRQLHHILLNIIEELDPGPQAPAFSNEWRRHRLLVLRYVKGLNPQAVADQLVISLRHYYRVHKGATDDLAGILWNRYVVRPTQGVEPSQVPEQGTPPSRLELLRLETARTAQADRYTRIREVAEGVYPILTEILHQHSVKLDLTLPDSLPGVSIDQSLLRQMLLGILGYLIERAVDATIRLDAQIEGSTICLSLKVDPLKAVQAMPQDGIDESLSAFEEMAMLSGAHILPVNEGRGIVGFEVQLPTIERTLLVVDDNEDILELFRGYLSPYRYRVITAQTARDALEKAQQFQPYAITLDLMMPDQDGWEVLQTLLHQPDTRHIPVIVCSVLRQKELALSLGAAAFLEKPVTEQTLLATLAALEDG